MTAVVRRALILALVPAVLLPVASAVAHERATSATSASSDALPLGDGKVLTSGPKKGYIFSCSRVTGGGGAFKDGPWIRPDGTWVPSEKIAVLGSVTWPKAAFSYKTAEKKLLLSGNGLPTGQPSGIFPIASSDPAFGYDRNPNSISAQQVKYSLSRSPRRARKASCLPLGAIGVMLNGVQFFNGLDAQGKDAVAHELQDKCQGHPERTGAYHYHSVSVCLSDPGQGHSRLVGYALDGFGLYGPRGSDGREMTSSELDACHGHAHKLKGKSVYHYHATDEYPYTLGCFRGTPVKTSSSQPAAPQGGQLPPFPPPMPSLAGPAR